jgi:ABC-type sulfate/molybdate transport systems ATPase subunit
LPSHHRLALDTQLGALHIQATLELSAPWTILFGPSGSGKTSILRSLCGLLPTQNQLPPHRRNLAYAPQDPAIFPHLTVRQNVAFPLAVRNLKPKIDELLEIFALTTLADRLPRDLSGGELQRVNLARALAVPTPSLLVLDEPFTGIDRTTRKLLIAKLAARNIPILSVTHDVEEAILIHTEIQAEVIRIDSGRILAQGPAAEVLAPERAQLLQTLTTQD